MFFQSSNKTDKTIPAVIALLAIGLLSTSLSAQERQAPTSLEEDSSCLAAECHDTLSAGASVHNPVAEESCDACHEQDDEAVHTFTYPDEGAELCYGCHKSMTKDKFVHAPLKDAKRPCLSCHNPHSSKAKSLIASESTSALCLQCHADMAKGPRMHKSRSVKGCTGCHVPHASKSPKLLSSQPPKLCYTCHEDIQEDLTDARVVHGPVAIACTSCHNPHKELEGKGLQHSGADLCMTCHAHFDDKYSAMSKRHSKLRENRDCLRCHQAHASGHESLLANTSEKLCLTCHQQELQSRGGRTVRGLAAEMVEGARLHGPLASHDCAGCHEPHGNSHFNFTREAYPSTFYSPYEPETYALCFSCHNSSLAADRQTTIATKFRNGSVNLHYVHVNKARKGRTCRSCHSPHASKNPHMLADSVPFGKWKLPVGFSEEDDGGTCVSGCHLPKTYSRAQPGKGGDKAPEPKATTKPAKTKTPTTTTSPAG